MDKKAKITVYGILTILIAFAFVFFVQAQKISAESSNNTSIGVPIPTYDAGLFNPNLVSYSQGGYSYTTSLTFYNVYFTNNINSGNNLKFVKNGYSFYYDLSGGKMQWLGQDGNPTKTKSIGTIQSSSPSLNENQINYSNAFLNTDILYKMTSDGVKENFVLTSLPTDSSSYIYLDYSGKISFDNNIIIWANNMNQTGKSFNTSDKVEFKDLSNNTIFYLPSPVATDSNGNSTNIIYDIKPSSGKLQFDLQIPVNWLNDSSRVYPIYIDPSVLSPACFSNSSDIICNASTGYTGNYIDTTKNITIIGTSINGNTGGLIRLNTTNGFLNIINSQLLANVSDQTSADNIFLYGKLNSNISGSVLDDRSSYVNGKLNNYCYLNFVNNLSISNSQFYCSGTSAYRTDSNNANVGGNGYILLNASVINFTGTQSLLTANGGAGYTSCPFVGCALFASGGPGQIDIYGNVTGNVSFNILGGDIAYSCNTNPAGSGSFSYGASTLNINSNFFNFTGTIYKSTGTPGTDVCGGSPTDYHFTWTAGASQINSNTANSTIIFNSGNITDNKDSNLQLKEFTLNNFSYTSTNSTLVNLTGDTARIGLFGSSTRPSFTPTYYGSLGKIIIGNTTVDLNLTGITYVLRDNVTAFLHYYDPLDTCTYSGSGNWIITISDNCTLITPINVYPNAFIVNGSNGILNISSIITTKIKEFTPSANGHFVVAISKGGGIIVKS